MRNRRLVFISHVHEDKEIAQYLAEWIRKTLLGEIDFFVSSDVNSLPPGADWPQKIKAALSDASICLLIISPLSVERRWIYFEAGAAYVRNIPVVPICIGGMKLSDLQPPLSLLQSIELPDNIAPKKLIEMIAKQAGLFCPTNIEELKIPIIQHKIKKNIDKNNIKTSFHEPISRSKARKLIKAAPKEHIDALEEVFFMYNIQHNYGGWYDNPKMLFQNIEKFFTNPKVVPRTQGEIIIQHAKKALLEYKPTRNSSISGFDHVRFIVKTISTHILSVEECIDKFFDFPEEIIVPFLISKYYSEDTISPTKDDILTILDDEEYGHAILSILEDNLKWGPPTIIYMQAARLGRKILNEEFDNWFKRIRGISYSEEIKRYEDKELREKELRSKREELMMLERQLQIKQNIKDKKD